MSYKSKSPVDANTFDLSARNIPSGTNSHNERKSVLNQTKTPYELDRITELAESLMVFRSDVNTPREAFELAEDFFEYRDRYCEEYLAKHTDTRNEWERVEDDVREQACHGWWETTKMQ